MIKTLQRPLHQQRVFYEKVDLDTKTEALRKFITGAALDGLPTAEQSRLRRQHVAMCEYSTVLGERIAAWVL